MLLSQHLYHVTPPVHAWVGLALVQWPPLELKEHPDDGGMGWQVTWPGEGPGRVGRFEVAQGESAYSFPPLEGVPVAVTLEISVSPVAQSSAVVAYSFHVTGLRSREQRLAVPVQVPALHSLYRTTSTALGKANLIHVRRTPWRSPSQQFCAAAQLGGSGRARGGMALRLGRRACSRGGRGRSERDGHT